MVKIPENVYITAGTYDGVLAGWELKDGKLAITFATPVHGGSVRSLCVATNPNATDIPGSLASCGYDEMIKTHDWHKNVTSSGEVRTPTDFGTPTCSSFAPPPMMKTSDNNNETQHSTHCLLGFNNGKLVIYRKRDWSVHHVLAGHEGGIASIGVHPTGKLALTGGQSDGKLKLWDLTKGRLSFVSKITKNTSVKAEGKSKLFEPVQSLVWSQDGTLYGFCHGNHLTVRDVATGGDVLDVELPSRVNQIAILEGEEGMFVAAACNDGSLPVLAVQNESEEQKVRRAVMAIEPVDGPVAGSERFKCISAVCGYFVATATSAGVVSLMNLEGAVNMIVSPQEEDDEIDDDNREDDDDEEEEGPQNRQSQENTDEEELAVDIIDAVQLGTGARITCLVAWASGVLVDDTQDGDDDEEDEEEKGEKQAKDDNPRLIEEDKMQRKRKQEHVVMETSAVEKARESS